jgi:hypothetical protein
VLALGADLTALYLADGAVATASLSALAWDVVTAPYVGGAGAIRG